MTRRIINKVVLILLFLTSSIISQTIKSIKIEGASNFSNSNYLEWISIPINSAWFKGIEDSVSYRISRNLNANGFFDHLIIGISKQLIDSLTCAINISIDENEQTFISNIIIEQSPDSNFVFEDKLLWLKNSRFSKHELERAFADILDDFENRGFPFASIAVNSIYIYQDTSESKSLADIYISINAGAKSQINRVEVVGNSKTKTDFILKSSGIKLGEEYSQSKIDEIPIRLNRLRFFDLTEKPTYYFNTANEGILRISIKERQTNNFDGIIGYVPSASSGEKGFFTGFLNVALRNLFGTGRNALFRWQSESKLSQEFEIRYLEPWVFNFPLNFETTLFQRKQDTTYVQRSFSGKLEYLATHQISASLLVGTESVIATESSAGNFFTDNSSSLTTGINFKIDSMNDFYNPTSGVYFSNTYMYTNKKINNKLNSFSSGLQRFEFDLAYVHQFINEQAAYLSVHLRELRGGNYGISDFYFLGGTNSLRGYRERQFYGNRIIWSNLEYRFLLSLKSYAFVFYDNGYFLRSEDISKSIFETSSFKMGYGFGIKIETGIGVLGVSFALAKGDSFSDGKIHFGIVNEF
jgi:outer membrane protein insertion porin family